MRWTSSTTTQLPGGARLDPMPERVGIAADIEDGLCAEEIEPDCVGQEVLQPISKSRGSAAPHEGVN
jgi:hypothetical protein